MPYVSYLTATLRTLSFLLSCFQCPLSFEETVLPDFCPLVIFHYFNVTRWLPFLPTLTSYVAYNRKLTRIFDPKICLIPKVKFSWDVLFKVANYEHYTVSKKNKDIFASAEKDVVRYFVTKMDHADTKFSPYKAAL